VKQIRKLTLKLGSLVKETLVKNNKRAGGAYNWTKVGNRAGGARFRVRCWKLMVGIGGGSGRGCGGWWCWRWCVAGCCGGGGGGGRCCCFVVVVVIIIIVVVSLSSLSSPVVVVVVVGTRGGVS
jgi:uncharacterized membrane protein